MKRGRFIILITAILMALAAMIVFSERGVRKAAAAFSLPLSSGHSVLLSEAPELGVMELKGTVDAVGADSYTVGGIVVRFDTLTIISGSPLVGDSVEVKALLLPDTTRYALKIEKEDQVLSSTEFKFAGLVESMAADLWSVSGIQFSVTTTTVIDVGLAVGDVVEVRGLVSGGVLTATTIHLEGGVSDDNGSSVEFFGTIESITGAVYVIDGKTVNTDAATEIKDVLVVGDLVKVHAVLNADGTYLASEIELAVKPPTLPGGDDDKEGEEIKFTGAVESISDTLWVIGGMSFVVDATTKIEGTPVVGDMVKVEAHLQADGTNLAHEIEMVEDDSVGDDDDSQDDDGNGSGDDDDEDEDSGGDDDHDEDEDSGGGSGGGDDDDDEEDPGRGGGDEEGED